MHNRTSSVHSFSLLARITSSGHGAVKYRMDGVGLCDLRCFVCDLLAPIKGFKLTFKHYAECTVPAGNFVHSFHLKVAVHAMQSSTMPCDEVHA